MAAHFVKTYSERGRFLEEDFEHGVHAVFSGQTAQHDSRPTFFHDDGGECNINGPDLKKLFHYVYG